MPLEPGHAHCIDHQATFHAFIHRPPHDLPAEQVYDDRQKQPALIGRDVRDVTHPDLVWLRYDELTIQQVARNGQVVDAIGSHPETPFSLAADAMELHQLLHPRLADMNAVGLQTMPDPRPAIAATATGVSHTNVDK